MGSGAALQAALPTRGTKPASAMGRVARQDAGLHGHLHMAAESPGKLLLPECPPEPILPSRSRGHLEVILLKKVKSNTVCDSPVFSPL